VTGRLKLRTVDLVWREVDAETIVLDLRTQRYLSISHSGSVIWRSLAEGSTHEELVERLTASFGIAEEVARSDVDAFLADCRERGLLEP
jgi:Coenzyme PQQ synthesis protein D (PqqD)